MENKTIKCHLRFYFAIFHVYTTTTGNLFLLFFALGVFPYFSNTFFRFLVHFSFFLFGCIFNFVYFISGKIVFPFYFFGKCVQNKGKRKNIKIQKFPLHCTIDCGNYCFFYFLFPWRLHTNTQTHTQFILHLIFITI